MQFIKKHITLVVGISIPILMILFVAASIYLPGLFIQPKFNFLYACDHYYYGDHDQYSVRNGKLVKTERHTPKGQTPPLEQEITLYYVYDVTIKKATRFLWTRRRASTLIQTLNRRTVSGSSTRAAAMVSFRSPLVQAKITTRFISKVIT